MISAENFTKFGFGPPSGHVRLAEVHAEFNHMVPMIDDLAQRLNTTYLFDGGAAISLAREGILLPAHDDDLDFCMPEIFAREDRWQDVATSVVSKIRAAYGGEEHVLYDGVFAKSIVDDKIPDHLKTDWKNYMVLYGKADTAAAGLG